MRLVLVGDVHMYRLWIPPWKLVGKALLGHTNLWLNRRLHFRKRLLPHVLDRAAELRPDLVLLSGDLTTTAQPEEFRSVAREVAARWKRPGVLVPGNHDRYTFASRKGRRVERFFPRWIPEPYPHARPLRGGWHLLALDASVPRALTSRGLLGSPQLEKVRSFLEQRGEAEGVVVLCHYPFAIPAHLPPMRWHHRLADGEVLARLVRACPARILFLHGHVHQPWLWGPTELPHVTTVNAGAPCLVSPRFPGGQGFWEIELPEHPDEPPRFVHHRLAKLPSHGGKGLEWQEKEEALPPREGVRGVSA
jgi:calcineurin-like phosphoesterase family protein